MARRSKQMPTAIHSCGGAASTIILPVFWIGSMRFMTDTMPSWLKMHMIRNMNNVQIAVENYFIIHSYVSNDRTDYNTLIPVLEKHNRAFGYYPEDVTADSGCCSEKNLIYLKKHK